jgi:hypothetical protein
VRASTKEAGRNVKRSLLGGVVALLALCAPATASAHARSATVALDYRLRLDPATTRIPDVSVAVLDGDRSLRVQVRRGTLVVHGDLAEPMLRIGPRGAWANRGSVTAVAERLVAAGHGWQQVGGGSSFTWHEHRLAPPPYDGGKPGPVASFRIPVLSDGEKTAIRGTFIRYRRPPLWPWLVVAGIVTAAAVVVGRRRPALRPSLVLGLGVFGALAALVSVASFGAADSPSGRTAWGQSGLAIFLAACAGAGLLRLRGERRTLLAGLLGTAAAMTTIGSLGVFWHGVVISSLPTGLTRALCAVALTAGTAAAAAWLLSDEVLT